MYNNLKIISSVCCDQLCLPDSNPCGNSHFPACILSAACCQCLPVSLHDCDVNIDGDGEEEDEEEDGDDDTYIF